MHIAIVALALILTTQSAYAQHKPIGGFSPNGSPSWMSFGSIGDTASDQMMEEAYQKSVQTGFKWILQMGDHDNPLTPADEIARRNVKRFAKLGPHIVAVAYGQEWYEQFCSNVFARYGLTSNNPRGVTLIYIWLSMQHLRIKQVINRPVIWLTNAVHKTERPVPLGTDIVAIDAYVADGESPDWAESVLLHAETATDLPLVVVPRWFKYTGPKQGPDWQLLSQDPSIESIDMYMRILKRPRYIAMWGFLWGSRPYADLVGIADMPKIREYFLKRLKEK